MTTAAIIGASGYSGIELLRLLLSHTEVSVTTVIAHASAGRRVDELYPAFSGLTDLVFKPLDIDSLNGTDIVFIALPSGEAVHIVPRILETVEHVIDLGGDFRLPSGALYEQYYHRTHTSPRLLSEAVYGLPELNTERIRRARLVANPGCYPTGALLSLFPALRNKIVSPAGIVVNALSGVSGAGRSASIDLSFVEVNENVRAYKVGSHQHIPEIETVLASAVGSPVTVSFIPHLVPINRGIYTTIHAPLRSSVTRDALYGLYDEFYQDKPFVRIKQTIPQVRDVVHTNFCDIHAVIDERTNHLILITVLDNLLKGAAGQAVQNMNIMFGFPETLGLTAFQETGQRTDKEKTYVR